MKKLMAILLLSSAFAAPVLAADHMQTAQTMIQCAAVMQINADNVKDEPQLLSDVQASADRFKKAAGYYMRGTMDVDQIASYVDGGIGAARANLEAEFKTGGGAAVEKRLEECNTSDVLTKGFEAYQALGSISASPVPGPIKSKPIDVSPMGNQEKHAQ